MDYLDEQTGKIIRVSDSGAISFDTSFSSFNFSLSGYSLTLNETYSAPVAAALTSGLLIAYLIGGILFLMTSIQANMVIDVGTAGHGSGGGGGYSRKLNQEIKGPLIYSWIMNPIRKVIEQGIGHIFAAEDDLDTQFPSGLFS